MKNLSARARIVLLVIASVVPVMGLAVYAGMMQRDVAERDERQELLLIAELTAKHPGQIIENARQLLFAAAGNIDNLMAAQATCDAYFRRLAQATGGLYRSMGLIKPDGDVFCNTAAPARLPVINVRDREYFRLAMDSRQFTVGGYQIGRSTRTSGLNFAYPVLDADGSVMGVLFAGLNLDTFVDKGRLESPQQRQGRVVTLFDRNGIVLAQYPEFRASVGRKSPNPRVAELLDKVDRGLFTATDLTGAVRIYAVENAGLNPDGVAPIRVLVSTPQQTIFAEADRALQRMIIGILLVTGLVLVTAWFGSEVFVLRRFRTLIDTARRIRAGDFGARTGFDEGREELTQIGNAFDAMAAELQARERQLREQAMTDQLTGLPNRVYLWETLGAELLRARRRSAPLAVLLFYIDHFKQFNDRWGHEAGDHVLRNVSHAVRKVVRGSDLVARHGGEEFVIVLPDAGPDVAVARAEALRAEIALLRLSYGGQELGAVTVSIGVVCSPAAAETAEDLVRAADHAMYEAKQAGRNRVVLTRIPEAAAA